MKILFLNVQVRLMFYNISSCLRDPAYDFASVMGTLLSIYSLKQMVGTFINGFETKTINN